MDCYCATVTKLAMVQLSEQSSKPLLVYQTVEHFIVLHTPFFSVRAFGTYNDVGIFSNNWGQGKGAGADGVPTLLEAFKKSRSGHSRSEG